MSYDPYGNYIPRRPQTNLFSRFILQAISDTIRQSLHDLSDQIEDYVMREPEYQPQYVIIRYKNMPNKKEHTSCPICFDEYEDNSMVLSTQCLHFFHEHCLKKWSDKNTTCPICRSKL